MGLGVVGTDCNVGIRESEDIINMGVGKMGNESDV